jgi:hypothetical protein
MLKSLTAELLDLTAAEVGPRRSRLAITLQACCSSSCCTCMFLC